MSLCLGPGSPVHAHIHRSYIHIELRDRTPCDLSDLTQRARLLCAGSAELVSG